MLAIELTSSSLTALLKIIAIDIVLSGDNAVVIAMATKNLPKKQQNKAIMIGTGGAVLLRILFAVLIVYLLQIPYVHFFGGVLLLWIAYRVLVGDERTTDVAATGSIWKAVWTIIMADAIMSLDNVIAIAGAANGHILIIAIGVIVSIPIMIFGAKWITRIMDKHVWVAYIGAGILAWTGGEMITRDKLMADHLHLQGPMVYVVIIVLTLLILFSGFVKKRRSVS